jgi:hypothetical protein
VRATFRVRDGRIFLWQQLPDAPSGQGGGDTV